MPNGSSEEYMEWMVYVRVHSTYLYMDDGHWLRDNTQNVNIKRHQETKRTKSRNTNVSKRKKTVNKEPSFKRNKKENKIKEATMTATAMRAKHIYT